MASVIIYCLISWGIFSMHCYQQQKLNLIEKYDSDDLDCTPSKPHLSYDFSVLDSCKYPQLIYCKEQNKVVYTNTKFDNILSFLQRKLNRRRNTQTEGPILLQGQQQSQSYTQ